jgi:beta-glucanase (GH16 family)
LGYTAVVDNAYMLPSEVSSSGGLLDLRVDNFSTNGKPFTAGMITSRDKYSFQYGVAEARLQVPQGAGLDAGFWMIPQDGAWPPEIDILEVVTSNPFYPIMTYHWTDGSGSHQAQPFYFNSPADLSAGMHVFSVNWQPNSITWYIDGVQRGQQTSNVTNKPMFLIVNPDVCTPGTWCAGDMSNNSYPMHMKVDYVRVWQ